MALFCRHHHQNIIWAVLATAALLSISTPVYAQCIWEDWNCTPTPGTPTPTGTVMPTAPATVQFAPLQFPVPTSIPAVSLPTALPAAQFTPIPAPSPVSINLTPLPTPEYGTLDITAPTQVPLSAISTTLNITHSAIISLSLITGTTGISYTDGLSNSVGGFVGEVVSYTSFITGEITAIQGTEIITIIAAPDWYAPNLPRPMANVGWTFEVLTDPDGDTKNFTMLSWSSFFGYTISLPFQLVKSLWQLVAYFGPFGLFLGWLLIMFVLVLSIQAMVFLIKFLIVLVRIIVRILELLGAWIPTGG